MDIWYSIPCIFAAILKISFIAYFVIALTVNVFPEPV
jgi:hypothetical protein